MIHDSTLTGNNVAVNVTQNGTADIDFEITSNLRTNGHAGNEISVFSEAATGGALPRVITGNTIGTDGANSGSPIGSGHRMVIPDGH